MTTARRLMTAEEFEQLPEPREGGKAELWYGEVVRLAPVGQEHGDGSLSIGGEIRAFTRKHKLGITGVEIGYRLRRSPDLLLAPDVSFLATDGPISPGFVDGPPTLAVEVVSPGDTSPEVQAKVEEYLANGTARVWCVYPALRVVVVHRPDSTSRTFHVGEVISSDDAGFAVEGFALTLTDLFAIG